MCKHDFDFFRSQPCNCSGYRSVPVINGRNLSVIGTVEMLNQVATAEPVSAATAVSPIQLPSPAQQAFTPPIPAPVNASTTPPPVFSATDITNLTNAWNLGSQAANACSSFLQGLRNTWPTGSPSGMTIAQFVAFLTLIQECENQEEQLFINGQQIAPNPTIQGVNSLSVFASNGLSYANQIISMLEQYPSLSTATGSAAQIQALCQDAANAMSGPQSTAQQALAAATAAANSGNAAPPPPPPPPPPASTPTVIAPPPPATPVVPVTAVAPVDTSWWDQPSAVYSGIDNTEMVVIGSGAIALAAMFIFASKKKRAA